MVDISNSDQIQQPEIEELDDAVVNAYIKELLDKLDSEEFTKEPKTKDSEAKKTARERFLRSERGQAAIKRYLNKPEVRARLVARNKEYRQTESGKASTLKYESTEKAKDRKTRYRNSELGRLAREREMNKRKRFQEITNNFKKGLCLCGLAVDSCVNEMHKEMIRDARTMFNGLQDMETSS